MNEPRRQLFRRQKGYLLFSFFILHSLFFASFPPPPFGEGFCSRFGSEEEEVNVVESAGARYGCLLEKAFSDPPESFKKGKPNTDAQTFYCYLYGFPF